MATLAEAQAELARRQSQPQSPAAMARAELERRQTATAVQSGNLYSPANAGLFSADPAATSPDLSDPVPGDPTGVSGVVETVVDNVVGLDNGRQSFGENAADFLNAAGESATLGVVGDEASAAMDAALGRGSFDERLDARREQEAQYRGDNPYMAFAADMAGGLAVPGLGAANFVGRAATTGTKLARSALAGAGAGAVYGAMEGEGTDRLANAAATSAAGAFFGATIPAVANTVSRGAQRLWQRASERPSVGLLREIKNNAYRAVEEASETFSGDDMSGLAARVRDIADNDLSYVPGEDKAVDAALQSLVRREGQDTTLPQMETIRQGLWRRVTANPDQVQIYDLIGEIDSLIDSRADAAELMQIARTANRQYSQSDLLDRAFQRARDQAESTGSGGNVANLYRQAITRIVNNPRQARFFSDAQKEVMRAFLRDSRSQRAMRMIGKMSPSGNGLMLMLQTLGGVASGGATIPLAIAGAGAKSVADRSVMRGAEGVLDAAAGFARPSPAVNPLLAATGAVSAPIAEDAQNRIRSTVFPRQ